MAIKTILGLADNETARKRFWREAKTAASVNHPNICQLYEIGEERGALFIAMELLDGEPLSDRLAGGALVVDEAVAIALGILSALTALHGRGIVHRDLKPSNVFLTPHGVKVLDFGLALPVEAAATSSLGSLTGLTRSGVIVGTPRYMAPEQVTGEELGFRTDLFAAGAIRSSSSSSAGFFGAGTHGGGGARGEHCGDSGPHRDGLGGPGLRSQRHDRNRPGGDRVRGKPGRPARTGDRLHR